MNALIPTLPPGLLAQAEQAPQKRAENCRRGDVVFFHGKLYAILVNATDRRTVTTLLTTVCQEDAAPPLRKICVLRLFRTFMIPVCHSIPMDLDILGNTKEEVIGCEPPEKMARE